MMETSESDLLRAAQVEDLPPETVKYCQGIIGLTVQGKRVAKTRKQWVDYLIGVTREGAAELMLGCPFRSYDSDRTKAKKLRKALLLLEPFSKAHPEATLDELVEKINTDCCGRISIRRSVKHARRTAILGG